MLGSSSKSKSESDSSSKSKTESDPSIDGGVTLTELRLPKSVRKPSRKSVDVKEEREGTHYWVPRVRLMFAAEDPRVFADRVSHAHKSRCVIVLFTWCKYYV